MAIATALTAAFAMITWIRVVNRRQPMSPMGALRVAIVMVMALAAIARADERVVTDVFMVRAASQATAQEQCERNAHAVAVGVDWGNGNRGGQFVQLCLRRPRIQDIHPATGGRVIQDIIVLENAVSCPGMMELLYQPQELVVVCVQSVEATVAVLASGNYLRDIWVSAEANYRSNVPGWTSLKTSVLEPADGMWRALWHWLWTPAYRGAFISYARPVLPIRDVRVLDQVDERDLNGACNDRLAATWENAGFVDQKDGFKAVLCIRRGRLPVDDDELDSRALDTSDDSDYLTRQLMDIHIVHGRTTPCRVQREAREALGDHWLCLNWQNATRDDQEPLAGLRLERLARGEDPSTTLLGQWNLVDSSDLNVNSPWQSVFLYSSRTWPKAAAMEEPVNRPPLYARSSTGNTSELRFRVLQIADLHYTGNPMTRCKDVPKRLRQGGCTEAWMTTFIEDLLDAEEPDLVVFTGDNVQVYDAELRQAAIDAVTQGVEVRGIPYAIIFGNHDDQRGFSRESMMEMIAAKAHSYSQRGPVDVDGVGNYKLVVHSPLNWRWGSGEEALLRMYFLDSHGYPDKTTYPNVQSTYDWVKPRQVAYYRQLASMHDHLVPSLMFFHIPLPEYAMEATNLRSGEHNEKVQSSEVNSNLFATLVELGEVKATFAGHDHVNEYCYRREGVQLCYGGGAGLGVAYGSPTFTRRARVIEWRMDITTGRREIHSWKRHYDDLDTRHHPELLYADA